MGLFIAPLWLCSSPPPGLWVSITGASLRKPHKVDNSIVAFAKAVFRCMQAITCSRCILSVDYIVAIDLRVGFFSMKLEQA